MARSESTRKVMVITMTNSMDQANQHRPQPQGMSQDVLQGIDDFLEDGRLVFDANGERIGGVKMYSTDAGYLFVGSGALGRKDLYIPFRLIRHIDPQGIVLSESKEVLAAQHAEPPAVHTIVEQRFEPGPRRDTMPQVYEMQVVQSGYDDSLRAVDSIELGSIAERLSVGLVVYDVDGVRLGNTTQYDTERGLLMVEKGVFKPTVLIAPISSISRIDRDALSVHLVLPKADLLKEQTRL